MKRASKIQSHKTKKKKKIEMNCGSESKRSRENKSVYLIDGFLLRARLWIVSDLVCVYLYFFVLLVLDFFSP